MRVNSFELYFHPLIFLPNQIHLVENRIFYHLSIFHLSTFLSLQPNRALATHTCAWVRLKNS